MSRLVYLPASPALATRLRDNEALGPWFGFTVSPGLRAHLAEGGVDPSDGECEYAALNAAGVAQLVDPQAVDPRLVLAADVDDARISDLDSAGAGSATVAELSWRQVTALFADEAEAVEVVAAARSAVRGRSVTEALAEPGVEALLERYDLLWYAPEELDLLS